MRILYGQAKSNGGPFIMLCIILVESLLDGSCKVLLLGRVWYQDGFYWNVDLYIHLFDIFKKKKNHLILADLQIYENRKLEEGRTEKAKWPL